MLRPDRKHLHNIFMRAGLSSRQALAAILFLGLCYAGVGILGEILMVPEYVMFWSFLGLLMVYSYIIQNIWKLIRHVKRSLKTKP